MKQLTHGNRLQLPANETALRLESDPVNGCPSARASNCKRLMIEIAVDDTKLCDLEYFAKADMTKANVVPLETGEPTLAVTP